MVMGYANKLCRKTDVMDLHYVRPNKSRRPDEESGHNAGDVSHRRTNRNPVRPDLDGPRIHNHG